MEIKDIMETCSRLKLSLFQYKQSAMSHTQSVIASKLEHLIYTTSQYKQLP